LIGLPFERRCNRASHRPSIDVAGWDALIALEGRRRGVDVVGVAAAGCSDVELFGVGAIVNDEVRLVDGEVACCDGPNPEK